jgi:hypothetical protein
MVQLAGSLAEEVREGGIKRVSAPRSGNVQTDILADYAASDVIRKRSRSRSRSCARRHRAWP